MRWSCVIGLVILGGCGHGPPQGLVPMPTEADPLAAGFRAFRSGDFETAQTLWRQAQFELSPTQPEMGEVRYYMAECDFQLGDLEAAGLEFQKVVEEFPKSDYAPLALLRAADANERAWRAPELDPTPGQTALAAYQEVIARYPGSVAADRARLHVSHLTVWFAEKDYQIGMFYYRRHAYDSAIMYFKEVIANHQGTPEVVDALLRLADSYRVIGYRDELRETCETLRQFYPNAPGLAQKCPAS
ncbi:MAG TPA: outer membrane protein assembly factor BamD [Gemmatimonadales bacterium]|nr:outer membrane protein assembly factor BamD [Gemmatimonadales bacterium]